MHYEGMTNSMATPTEEVEDVEMFLGNSSKLVKIGAHLPEMFWTNLIELLRGLLRYFCL